MPGEAIGLLDRARAKIAEESRWTTGALARNEKGKYIYYGAGDEAVKWDALGAILCFSEEVGFRTVMEAIGVMHQEVARMGYTDLVDLNDHAGHEAVIAAFDSAIERGSVE